MHYLKHGNNGARNAQLDKFLRLVMTNKTPKEAFIEAFQTDYVGIENELREYIKQDSFSATSVPLKEKLNSDWAMKSSAISEAQAKAYLGDLLFHANRFTEAEAHLQKALELDSKLGMAQATLGLIKMQKEDFARALEYLEKAVQSDSANYLAHYYYAYVLSRQGMSEFGFVSEYNSALADLMRESLKRAIEMNPNYAESYKLFAFISIVRNDEIEEAIKYLNKALEIAPGNQWYLIHLAELYMRKEDFESAVKIAIKVTRTAGDKELKLYAQNALGRIISTQAAYEEIKNNKRGRRDYVLDTPLTDEELAELRARQMLESLNDALYKPKTNEKRVLGYLIRIDCEPKEIIYSIKVDDKVLKLRSATFDSVRLVAYHRDMMQAQLGCGLRDKESLAVINYRLAEDFRTKTSGELVSIEFVPANFKFLN
jgi:tetratricopeptide (TPR) repeat protein